MEFSTKFAYSVKSIFNNMDYSNLTQLKEELSLDSNNVFRKSLIIEVNDDEVEIPVIAKKYFEDLVSKKINYPLSIKTKRIILPLYDNAPNLKKKTFDNIIIQMFDNVKFNMRLQKITTSKGEVYYGGKGIIFDESYAPLLLCTLTARKVHTERNNNTMVYYRPICYVSPKVFLEPSKLINKGIIKKLIPFYTSREIELLNYKFDVNLESKKVKIVVDNFDKFFIEPIKPTPSTIINDALNECLIDNMEDIMMLI